MNDKNKEKLTNIITSWLKENQIESHWFFTQDLVNKIIESGIVKEFHNV